MALLRLPGSVPQLASRVRNYANPTHTGYFKDANPYRWKYATVRRGDSMAVGLHTGRDWVKEMSRRWWQPVFKVVRGPFEPTKEMASRIQRDLFIPSPIGLDIDYDDSMRR
ncbi:MAG: hypothetical protein EOO28_15775 [Comamonadaceae bacterium]|nr:MAG: hypothetical protein EOO28_15775 [Comamonadaceae bacterium]